ncbi:hypothetical protein L596_012773 [Steinernema carpocapsae]|uniref:FAD dependent oxidoreductase domain-containing protein n=1 Tax=Steinernema carpocapsae TaxID=34508 RepID=A0A4U5NY83_STECR|nr:hypothetical protein L596_012773 [Steinernema carpocapsae]
MPHLVQGKSAGFIKKWGTETFNHIAKLERETSDSGAFMCSGYEFSDHPPANNFTHSVYRNYKTLTAKEIADLGFSDFKYGTFCTTYFLEPSIYLRKILKEFTEAGGLILQKRLKSVEEIGANFDLIVNCAGLGSRDLFGDKEVIPIRGQLIRIKCPSIKHFYCFGDVYHCFPNNDTVVLGGSAIKGDFDLNIRKDIREKILKQNEKYLPQIKGAEIVKERAGLRKEVRLELERYTLKSGSQISIVHNYGHGGSGITLFYGCANSAADHLVEKELKTNAKL